jgi:hypothetical protein
MLRIKNIGGERVRKGNYWNFSTGDRVHMEEAGTLPGDETQRYYRVPPIVILIAGPILGLLYFLFLPFIGVAVFAAVLFKKLSGRLARSAHRGAAFSWKPSEAYLARKKHKAKKGKRSEEEKKE